MVASQTRTTETGFKEVETELAGKNHLLILCAPGESRPHAWHSRSPIFSYVVPQRKHAASSLAVTSRDYKIILETKKERKRNKVLLKVDQLPQAAVRRYSHCPHWTPCPDSPASSEPQADLPMGSQPQPMLEFGPWTEETGERRVGREGGQHVYPLPTPRKRPHQGLLASACIPI